MKTADKKVETVQQPINVKIDDTTPTADHYFQNAAPSVYQLVRKIEHKEPITLEEVKNLPEGAINARYGKEITLLYAALVPRNLQAIDILLQAGADPYAIDHPSKRSENDFTYYTATVTMVKPDNYVDEEVTQKFRYDLTKIYLKDGGKADHILDGVNPLSLLFMHALKRNYEIVKLLIDNGADPLYIQTSGTSVIMSLVTDYNTEGLELLRYIICKGFYKQAKPEQVEHALKWFEPSGPKNPEREAKLRTLAMMILKDHPEFKENSSTLEIFLGPIPWKDIQNLQKSEVCHE